jgi:hypothetical protein
MLSPFSLPSLKADGEGVLIGVFQSVGDIKELSSGSCARSSREMFPDKLDLVKLADLNGYISENRG